MSEQAEFVVEVRTLRDELTQYRSMAHDLAEHLRVHRRRQDLCVAATAVVWTCAMLWVVAHLT